jgi:redox-sensitive bicupin YhaK (pirin superfamily)
VELYSSILFPEDTLTHKIKKGRCVWVQLASGVIEVNKVPLFIGDGVAVIEEPCIEIAAIAKSEFLLFDLGQ